MPEIKILQSTELGDYGLKKYIVKLQDGEDKVVFELTFDSKGSTNIFDLPNISRVEAREIKPEVLQRIYGESKAVE